MSEYQLENPPTDGISSIKLPSNSSKYVLASSWDRSVRLYDIESRQLLNSYNHDAPVLDCTFSDSVNRCFSGGLDCNLLMHDFETGRDTIVGQHSAAVRRVNYSSEFNLVITGSWDGQVKLWDPRSLKCIGSYDQPDKVYAMDNCGEKLLVATKNRKIKIWNLKNMGSPELRDSSMKFQIRAIKCFPNKQAYVISSIEGRAAVEYFDLDPEVQRKKYAFKCHRVKDSNGQEYIYPVNAISFHGLYNTFATGGSDRMVNIWDGFNKKRLCQFHSYPSGITSLSFDYTGNYLVIASSYNYESGCLDPNGLKELPQSIFVRRVSETETKPK